MIVCPPKIILSDFNVYHTLWVSLRVDGRGEKIVVNDSDLILLNDDSWVGDNAGNLSFSDLF